MYTSEEAFDEFFDSFSSMGNMIGEKASNFGSAFTAGLFSKTQRYDSIIDFIGGTHSQATAADASKSKADSKSMLEWLKKFRDGGVAYYSPINDEQTPHFWWNYNTDSQYMNPLSSQFHFGLKGPAKANLAPKPNRGHTFQMLSKLGPDFMAHKFDAYFLWDIYGEGPYELDKVLEDNPFFSPYERYILSRRGFAVRVGQITVPKIINQDFSIPFLETEVRKIRSNKEYSPQSAFTLRLDQDLIWLDQIQRMAGRNTVIDESINMKDVDRNMSLTAVSDNQKYYAPGWLEGKHSQWRTLFKTVSRAWPSMSKEDGTVNLKDSELCLVIKMTHLSNFVSTPLQKNVLPYFVFENVKILGTSDAITYDQTATDPTDVTVNFIFRKCYEIMQEDFGHLNQSKLYYTTNSLTGERKTDFSFEHLNKLGKDWSAGADMKRKTPIGMPQIPTFAGRLFDSDKKLGNE
jgi:hypothetical protein